MGSFKKISTTVLVVGFIASICFNVYLCTKKRVDGCNQSDTTRVIVIDTISYYNPTPDTEKIIGRIIERLPVAPQITNNGPVDSEIPKPEKEERIDSTDVLIPITQRIYKDSTYKVYISGYKPNLDSLFIYPRREIITIRKPVKPKRWGVGVHAGYGISLKETPQFIPYVGIGISYNLFNF